MEKPDQEPMVVLNNAGAGGNNSSNDEEYSHVIVKGKRTKRQRAQQLLAAAAATASTSSAEFSGSTTEEEEDMANCLILLARGQAFEASTEPRKVEGTPTPGTDRQSSRRLVEAALSDGGKGGIYLYECKTCGKCFPSFQALGGHRTSHKKPKIALVTTATATATMIAGEKKATIIEDDNLQISLASSSINSIMAQNTSIAVAGTATNGGKARVHECSICGSEFTSGQALGGHMRRHRTAATAMPGSTQEPKKEKNLLALDLNLPAPPEDDHGGDFPKSPSSPAFTSFPGKPPAAPLFSASALVDCHY